MKMKLKQFKILLISTLILHSSNIYSAEISDLVKAWKKQDYLILTIPVKFDQLEPTSSLNAHTKLSLPLVYEPLVSIGAQQELQPILAKSWRISADNKSVIITLKQNHYFSNNTEVKAQDVVDTIYRACSPSSKVFEELKGLVGCEDYAKEKNIKPQISVIGSHQVKFKINSSPTNFLYQLSSPSFVITKLTNAGLIGSGPYIVQERKPAYLVLNKSPFQKLMSAYNNGLVLFYANQDNLPRILNTDKPDGSIMYRMQDIWNIKNNNYKLVKVNPNITEIMVLNNQRFPFNHTIVRKALLSALYNNFDHTCIPGAHKAYGIIPYGTGGSIDNNSPNNLPTITPAEVFTKVPSLKDKKASITIHELEDLKNSCESEQIKRTAQLYNIDIKFKYHKNYSSLEPLYLNHQLDGFIELYVFRNREAYSILQYFTKAGENNANIKNSIIDNMLKDAIAETASHGRFQSYRKIAEYMQNEGIVIPLFYMDHGNLLSKCLSGASENFLFNPFSHLPQLVKINGCVI